MSITAAIGLIAVFAVDLINLFYISRLGEKEIAAAVGFAGVVGFFHTSICIGVTIGITAGASCPNNLIEETILRVFALRGITQEQIHATAPGTKK